jgi:myb proto-oncogene protein
LFVVCLFVESHSPNIHKGRWTDYEDNILKYSVLEYANVTDNQGRIQPIPWNRIAERIPHRTGIQCQARWTEALDPYVRKGKWGADEDHLLRSGVQEHGRCWIRIAETIPGRTQVKPWENNTQT